MGHELNNQFEQKQAYEQLLQACLSGIESKQLDAFKKSALTFSEDLHKQMQSFKQNVSKLPLSAFIVLWADQQTSGSHRLTQMSDLIGSKVLQLTSLEKFTKLDPAFILNEIRCFIDWSISKREEVVLVYTSFASWLSEKTLGYVHNPIDVDRLAAQKRAVSFDTYIKILSHLDLREQIIAKMFYLGGRRGLEEVLSVKIEDIDFAKNCIHFPESVPYPPHLFQDIQLHLQGRQKGCLFIGKEGERISHTTPFRALKKAVSELKLDPEFTFKELTKNV